MHYQVALEEELKQVHRAVDFYHEWAEELRSTEHDDEYIRRYYRKLLDPTKVNAIRFRALFFAMRIQPVLSWIESFAGQYGRAPHILDLGCGYGLEGRLLAKMGAKVHGLDVTASKVAYARTLHERYERAHQITLDMDYEHGNILNWTPPEAYDAVFNAATLHHIEPVRDALAKIAEAIRPGGFLFLSDPNGLSPVEQLATQRRIGWTKPRIIQVSNPQTGERHLYGNENIRPVFVWKKLASHPGLVPVSVKFCRFVPPVSWPVDRLVRVERILRRIPLVADLGAIGFLLTFKR